MSKDLYHRVLGAYLRDKKANDEPLPDIKGRLSYRGIAIESQLPDQLFRPGSKLRRLIDASLSELRVSDAGLHEQLHRVIKPKVNTFSTTYGDLKTSGCAWLRENGYSEKSIPRYLSNLKRLHAALWAH